MSLLVVCDSLLPPAISVTGVKGIYEIQKAVAAKGIKVHILTSVEIWAARDWKTWVKSQETKYNNIQFHVINIPLKRPAMLHSLILRVLFFIYGLWLQMIYRCEIIHEYSSSPFLINRTYLLGLLTRTKTVHTLCTVNEGLFGSTKLALRSADRVICVAESMRKKIEKKLSRRKISLIPIPIEDKFFRLPAEDIRKKFGIKTEKAVLFCGLLDGRKGIDRFLNAIPEIIEKNPDTSMVIITAPGLNTSTVARQNRSKVLSALKHYGGKIIFIEKEIDMSTLFAAIDVFVYPLSTMHGTLGSPSILIEGMASGKAIVASNLREISDIIKHKKNGLLFNPGDSKELTQCVNKLLKDDQLRKSLGKQARQDSREYSLSEVSNKIMSLYNTLMVKKDE